MLNINFIVLFISIEIVLFIIMAFTAKRNYANFSIIKKILWRIILLIPIGSIMIPAVFNNKDIHNILFLIGICIVIIADMVIIFNSFVGLIVFLFYHFVNIYNYRLLAGNLLYSYQSWISLFALLILWFIIFIITLKKDDFNKYIQNINLPLFLKKPIFPALIVFIYISSIMLVVRLGFILTFNKNINILFPIFASIGAFIFAMGDYFIFYELLKRNDRPFHQILNNSLYYIPLILYALLTFVR